MFALETLFRKQVLSMSAYHVADASGFIKLDAMENPYNWPAELTEQWLEQLKDCQLNRYPDPQAQQLCNTLKQLNSIPEDCDLILGNGSDEIIQIILMALNAEAAVLSPDPGFVMYRQVALSLGLNYLSVPLLAANFELDLASMLACIEKHQPAVIFIAYPNNPTGNLFNPDTILTLIKKAKGLVIIDEAYAPFANASFMSYLGDFDNLMVMRTVSKLGLAGLRLGYLAGKNSLIEQFNKIRLPYNINVLTQVSATFALNKYAIFEQQTQLICKERERLFNELSQLSKIFVFPSAANFFLIRCPQNSTTQLFDSLKSQGVLIKNTSPQGGLLQDTLRITIGTPDQNDAFLIAFRNSIARL